MTPTLLEKLELHRSLKDSSPGFHLGDDDIDKIISLLRGADKLGLVEGGLLLLLDAVKAGDPQKEIIWRIEEELRQVRHHS